MNPVWVGGLAMLVPAVVAELLRRTVPPQMLQSGGARSASDAARWAAKRANDARQELETLKAEIANAKATIDGYEQRLAGLKRLRREYANDKPLVIHEIGRPARDAKAFQAFVMNRLVHQRVADGPAARINSLWASRHLVQVWGDAAQEARAEIETHYPHAQGYEVDFKGESNHLP
jgi:hypothetical protein